MSKSWVIVIAGAVLVAFIGIACIGSYISAVNYGVRAEQQLVAQQTDNRNILAQYGQKVLEAAQVPEMYRDDMIKVVSAEMSGRYGSGGSSATFQWLKEQNPSLDVKVYQQIQQIIEAGRDNFENGQRQLIDEKRQYQTKLGSFWSGFWLARAGYPKVNLDSFQIVSTDSANSAFKNNKEVAPIKIR